MLAVIWFNVAALALTLIVIVNHKSKPTINSWVGNSFNNLFITAILAISSEIGVTLFLNNVTKYLLKYPLFLFKIIASIHLCSLLFFFILYPLYIKFFTSQQYSKIHINSLIILPLLMLFMLMLVEIPTPVIFHFEAMLYRGELFIIYLALLLIQIGITMLVVFFDRNKELKNHKKVYLYASIPIPIGMTVQYLNPEIYCTLFCMVITLSIMIFDYERQENLCDEFSGALKFSEFKQMLHNHFIIKRPFSLIIISADSLKALTTSFNNKSLREIAHMQIAFLRNVSHNRIFNASPSQFTWAILSDSLDEKDLQVITNRFTEPWHIKNNSLMIPMHITSIICPFDAKNVEEVSDVIVALQNTKAPIVPVRIEELDIKHAEILRVAEHMSRTINKKNLEVVYQPIWNVEKERFTKAEALSRFTHPKVGKIPPDILFRIAEQNQSIAKIDRIIYSSVASFISRNPIFEEGININLSIAQARNAQLIKQMSRLIKYYQITPDTINLEVTETLPSDNVIIAQNIRKLQELGFSFALDDFGVKFSNVKRAGDLPFNTLKIDRSIIRSKNPKLISMFSFAIPLLRERGISVVAEGIETQAEARRAIRWGCNYLQGFYFARPMSEHDVVNMLKSTHKHTFFV